MSDSKSKPGVEGDELTEHDLGLLTGALGTRPGGGGIGTGGGIVHDQPPSCGATTDTGLMGCVG